jgi:exosortase A
MHADLRLHERAVAIGTLTPLQAFGAVAGVIVALLAVFAPTTASMVEIWRRSETFTHGFLVVPVVLAFVWLRRDDLAGIPARPSLAALPLLLAAGLLWLLGELSSSLAPSQLAVIAMVPATVAALFGWRWVRAIAFPLAFLFFAVPFGEFLVPTLIDWTADVTVRAVAASGVPVYREGTHFVIPSGRWSVVEACSGIRYLIASLMLGSLYAWLVYRSARKRLLFIVAAIVVPLVANWVRAYGIVMLGHLSNNRIATGVDHLIYGWLFFGALMLALFWVGARFRDDAPATDASLRPSPDDRRGAPRAALLLHGLLVVAAVGTWPIVAASIERRFDARPVAELRVPAVNGWQPVAATLPADWQPDLAGATRTQVLSYARDGRTVSVFVAIYRNQKQGAELVTSTNQLAYQDNERWRLGERGMRTLADGNGEFSARAALIRGQGRTAIAAAQWYWLGSARTASDTRAKFDLALDRLLMRGDTSAWIAVVTPARDGLRDGWPVIEAFVRDMGAPLQRALAAMASDGEP